MNWVVHWYLYIFSKYNRNRVYLDKYHNVYSRIEHALTLLKVLTSPNYSVIESFRFN